uniref:Periplasmic heavy metal sensor n=1 Tax=Desulfobacca acetoxidans TaxID=60893 RepID=A0A7C3UVZ6_9BACT
MHNRSRKNLKMILGMALVLCLAGATSAFAFRGMGWGMGMRGMMMNLTPEQAAQVFDLRQKFMNDTAELRKNMMIKRAELAQLYKAEKPDEKAIQAKVKELGNLRTQLMEKAVAQRFALQKIVPEAAWPMMGPGMGPRGGLCPPGAGFCPVPGPVQGKGPGPGASLMQSDSDYLADYAYNPDLD